eukprot:scaffold2767_cov177-Amphora_coffeaeformis.AAC.78
MHSQANNPVYSVVSVGRVGQGLLSSPPYPSSRRCMRWRREGSQIVRQGRRSSRFRRGLLPGHFVVPEVIVSNISLLDVNCPTQTFLVTKK